MLVIIGESASGKSTLVDKLIETNVGYRKIVTYTTRPMREGEKDGVDYHFITQEAFDALVERDFFVEHAKYRDWSYGTAKADCGDKHGVAVLTPAGLRALKRIGIDVTSVYLYVDRRSRLINILCRGDNIDEAYRRNLSDVGQFDQIEKETDYVIDNTKFHMDENQVLKCLQEILKDKTPESDEQLSLFD
jgi:guanylate kinase